MLNIWKSWIIFPSLLATNKCSPNWLMMNVNKMSIYSGFFFFFQKKKRLFTWEGSELDIYTTGSNTDAVIKTRAVE